MANVAPESQPWEVLAKRGGHFVLCAASKKAISTGWQKTKPNLKAVIAHARGGGLIGLVPASVGCVVIDIDEGGEGAVTAVKKKLGASPVLWTKTQREGGFHMWFRDECEQGNRKWHLPAGSGDIRGGRGYAIVWNPVSVAAGLEANFGSAALVDVSKLPKPKRAVATGPEAVEAALPGDRNNVLNREAFKAASRGELDENAFREAAIRAGLEPGEIDATLASARAGGASTPTFPRRDKRALELALALMNIQLRYNVRRHTGEIRNGGDWHDLTDRWAGHIRCELESKFRYQNQTAKDSKLLAFSESAWCTYINAILFSSECDPFLEWLEALPDWDQIERLRHWIDDCFEVDPQGDQALTEWASRFIFLGSVWRAFRPGTKLDETVVLSGSGGIGKSTAVRLALPQHLPGLFGDGLNLAAREKDKAEALQGKVIVEASEMIGSTRAELESLKSFLTRIDDGPIRMAYRKNTEPTPRRAIIIGTTNQYDVLPNDAHGNRRFVVIRLAGGDVQHVIEYLECNREQLWSEAVALYRQGVEAWLPRELAQVQAISNEAARRRDDMLEDRLEQILPSAGDSFTMAAIAAQIGLINPGDPGVSVPMREQRRLASALNARGFERKVDRQGQKTVRIWRRE